VNLENDQIQEELRDAEAQGEIDEEYSATRLADVEREGSGQEKEALATYGMSEGSDPRIAPLRRALAVWGLTPDDIRVLLIHVTEPMSAMKPTSGTTSSHKFRAPPAAPSRLSPRRALLVIPRVDLLLGR